MNKLKDNIYLDALKDLINSKESVNIVQVGANDGQTNDPIYEFVMEHKKSTKILLIEPQSEIIPFLRDNYRNHPQATFWNGAIGAENDLILYRVKPEYWDIFIKRYLKDAPSYRVPSGFTSSNKEHVLEHLEGNLPPDIDPSAAIEEIHIASINLNDLLIKLNWNQKGIDVLQIDAEGMDDFVIYACGIEYLMPSLINFEHRHLPSDRYRQLCNWLTDFGYRVYRYNKSDSLAINPTQLSVWLRIKLIFKGISIKNKYH